MKLFSNSCLIGLTLLLCPSCGIFLQNSAIKNVQFDFDKPSDFNKWNKWQKDFYYLKEAVHRSFPEIEDQYPRSKQDSIWNVLVNSISNKPKPIDFQIACSKYLFHFQNAHTWSWTKGLEFNTYYPYHIYPIEESWYLLNLSTEYDSSFIGKKLKSIGNHSIDSVYQILKVMEQAENDFCLRHETKKWFRYPDYLYKLGINMRDSVRLVFADESFLWVKEHSNKEKVDYLQPFGITRNHFTKRSDEIYTFKIAKDSNICYFQYNACYDSLEIEEGLKDYVKPWLRPMARYFVRKQFKKQKPNSMLRQYVNFEEPVFANFLEKMISEMETQNVENLIIDLRANNGGSLFTNLQLLYHLTDQEGLNHFDEKIYTSYVYRTVFNRDYDKISGAFRKKHKRSIPEDTLVLKSSLIELPLFETINNSNSAYYLPKSRKRFQGNVFVLFGPKTYSAGALLATLFKDHNLGITIGTRVSNSAIGATNYTPFKLPRTKTKCSSSSTILIRPDTTAGHLLEPDVWVEPSLKGILNGEDEAFDYILERINQ
ncbi:MAG: S41 family peptidase [Flavobacteriales bacterium]|nr:S41 family peptidase [Flavobacteriales bacterium]